MSLKSCLRPRYQSSWDILANLQYKHFLKYKVLVNFSRPIRLVNIAAGLSELGYDLLQSDLVDEVINTDISTLSEKYQTALVSSTSGNEEKRLLFVRQDVFSSQPLPIPPVNVALMTGFLSRFNIKTRTKILLNIYSSIPWDRKQPAMLVINGMNVDEVEMKEIQACFTVWSIAHYKMNQGSPVEFLKKMIKKLIFPSAFTHENLYNLDDSVPDVMSLDRSLSGFKTSKMRYLFYTVNVIHYLLLSFLGQLRIVTFKDRLNGNFNTLIALIPK